MEDSASEIREWALLVPGLLQTADYAWRLMRGNHFDEEERILEQRVRARMARKALLNRERPPRVRFIVDEGAFHRLAAEKDVMADQISTLLNAPRSVTVQVLPFDRGHHCGTEGPFTVMSFPDPAEPDQAYVEGQAGEHYIEGSEQVARYNFRFQALAELALSEEDTAAWIRAFAAEVEE